MQAITVRCNVPDYNQIAQFVVVGRLGSEARVRPTPFADISTYVNV
jgi:hypothetical protein